GSSSACRFIFCTACATANCATASTWVRPKTFRHPSLRREIENQGARATPLALRGLPCRRFRATRTLSFLPDQARASLPLRRKTRAFPDGCRDCLLLPLQPNV